MDNLTIIHTLKLNAYTVLVLYFEYEGGGVAYGFRIMKGDDIVVESEDGYESPASTAAGAFKWLAENAE